MNLKPRTSPRGVTWLALSLALGYFALMATLMWLFENSITLQDVTDALADPQRRKSWFVIAFTALGIFAISHWALGRISLPSIAEPPAGTLTQAGTADSDRNTPRYQRRSWTDAALFLAALAAILLGTGSFVLLEQEKALDSARYRHFALIGKTKTASVTRWVDERERDLQVLLANPHFVTDLGRWMAETREGPLQDSLMATIQALLQANNFDGMAVVTRDGKISIGLPEDIRARRKCLKAATAPADASGKPITLSFAFDDAAGHPQLDLVGKAFTADGINQRHVATLCMRVDLNQRLLPMVSRWPGVAASGEILLGRAEGQDIVLLNSRAAGDAGWRISRLAGARKVWDAALDETTEKNLHERVNAAGTRKLLAVYPVPSTPWLLMVRMDGDESDQMQLRQQTQAMIVIGFVLIFIIAAFAIAWARTSHSRGSFHAQRDALMAELREMAYYDDLTGLPGRRLIQDRLEVAIREAARRSELVGVLFIDLDKFKLVNDSHGHAAGDFVLKAVAERLQHSLRKNDSAGRLSGDEFLVLLTGNASAEQFAALRTKITAALHEPLTWQNATLPVAASVGLAIFPTDADNATDLIARADAAMYRDKQAAG